ncbi:NRAMP family divalent metal transporter [Rothia nasisuis]|uniref:NRAMP family divalent metal transporter n=1 Tax=Rothia nasisuis TaxID=2109647 RepID=UPI001F3A8807|nr:NRAMP family divalent metal transporter [Rothia nasisuis]
MADTRAPVTAQDQASKGRRAALLGSLFLMATSAIGPGFITQTGQFTYQMGAAFAFAILVSILIDIAVQLNVWRVIGVSGRKAQELANSVLPGLGIFLAVLVALGGFVFNVGNVAGGGLGLNSMLGMDATTGGIITAVLAIAVFISKRAGVALDRIVVALGVVMILATLYVAIVSNPPVGDALKNTVLPSEVNFTVITTLVGGTVGGYITYAGAHRMIDAGIQGPEYVRDISRSSVTGIIITGVMRFLLFLAILGVVATGVALDTDKSIAGQAFGIAAGEIGTRLFGLILWGAAISSVIGAAFTSVSFLTSSKTSVTVKNALTISFIVISTIVFVIAGKAPATLLIVAGAVNGLILPVGFAVLMFVATFRSKTLLGSYRYPLWLIIIGWASWLLTIYLGYKSLSGIAALWGS